MTGDEITFIEKFEAEVMRRHAEKHQRSAECPFCGKTSMGLLKIVTERTEHQTDEDKSEMKHSVVPVALYGCLTCYFVLPFFWMPISAESVKP